MKVHRENPQEEQEQIEEIDDLEIEEDIEETVTAEKIAEGKKHTVYMPRLQSMDKFLMAHYKDYILQELNKRLVSGELSKVADAVIVSEHIESSDCCFRHFDYWRLNQTDLMIQMEVRIQLNVKIDDFIDADSKWFYVQLWFSFAEDELQCEFDGIGLLFNKPEFDDHIKLDKYLVPVLRRDEIDKYTEDLWLRIDPEAYHDPVKRSAYTLKGKMGLSLMRVKLYQQSRVGAILFFRQGFCTFTEGGFGFQVLFEIQIPQFPVNIYQVIELGDIQLVGVIDIAEVLLRHRTGLPPAVLDVTEVREGVLHLSGFLYKALEFLDDRLLFGQVFLSLCIQLFVIFGPFLLVGYIQRLEAGLDGGKGAHRTALHGNGSFFYWGVVIRLLHGGVFAGLCLFLGKPFIEGTLDSICLLGPFHTVFTCC